MPSQRQFFRSAFTLIELLVVIAIIAILAVVVVLVLNPAELLKQSRDANRVSDMATLNSAIGLYSTDLSGSSGFSLGNASSVYISIPDTSGACVNLSLPTTSPSGFSYACASSTSSRNIDGTGWIPVNFKAISSGAPIGSLPVDPVNQTSSGFYYTYATNGTQFEVTAIPESQKQRASFSLNFQSANYPGVIANGSSLSVSPLYSSQGLTGYWNFDEGSGSSTVDQSGNGINGTWSGTPTGGSYYGSGKIGSGAGVFNGTNDFIVFATTTFTGPFTYSLWANLASTATTGMFLSSGGSVKIGEAGGNWFVRIVDGLGGDNTVGGLVANVWTHLAVVRAANNVLTLYVNGVPTVLFGGLTANTVGNAVVKYMGSTGGTSQFFQGSIDDVRLYNRALSTAEVQALYNAGR